MNKKAKITSAVGTVILLIWAVIRVFAQLGGSFGDGGQQTAEVNLAEAEPGESGQGAGQQDPGGSDLTGTNGTSAPGTDGSGAMGTGGMSATGTAGSAAAGTDGMSAVGIDGSGEEGMDGVSASATDGASGADGLAAQEVAEKPAYRFRNRRLLEQHYKKHGIEMGFGSPEEYEAAASAVAESPDALHKLEEEDGDDVCYIEETNEFVIISTDGYLRTYFNPSSGIDYFNRQ